MTHIKDGRHWQNTSSMRLSAAKLMENRQICNFGSQTAIQKLWKWLRSTWTSVISLGGGKLSYMLYSIRPLYQHIQNKNIQKQHKVSKNRYTEYRCDSTSHNNKLMFVHKMCIAGRQWSLKIAQRLWKEIEKRNKRHAGSSDARIWSTNFSAVDSRRQEQN